MNRIPRIALAGVGLALVCGLVYWWLTPSLTKLRATRGVAYTENPRAVSEPSNVVDSGSIERNEGNKPPNPDAASRPWKPSSVTIPGSGRLLLEVVGLQGGAFDDPVKPRSLRLVVGIDSPRFAVRFRPDSDDTDEGLFEHVDVWIAGERSLSIERDGGLGEERVVENGESRLVHVASYSVQANGSLDEALRRPRTSLKVLVRAKGVDGFPSGYVVARDLVLLKPLSQPSIGPGASKVFEPQQRKERSEFATGHLLVTGLDGVTDAYVRIKNGERVLPTTIVNLRLTMAGKEIPIPAERRLEDAHLWFTMRIEADWWKQRHGLELTFEVWDHSGDRHSLEWTPNYD